jgi:uncharacterized protein (DUF1919 family)
MASSKASKMFLISFQYQVDKPLQIVSLDIVITLVYFHLDWKITSLFQDISTTKSQYLNFPI